MCKRLKPSAHPVFSSPPSVIRGGELIFSSSKNSLHRSYPAPLFHPSLLRSSRRSARRGGDLAGLPSRASSLPGLSRLAGGGGRGTEAPGFRADVSRLGEGDEGFSQGGACRPEERRRAACDRGRGGGDAPAQGGGGRFWICWNGWIAPRMSWRRVRNERPGRSRWRGCCGSVI